MTCKEFNPPLCQCRKCDTILQSKWEGQFVNCECGESFVDQTRYYCRYGGSVMSVSDLLLKDFAKKFFSDSLQEFLDQNQDLE